MENRELGMAEVIKRVRPLYNTLSLKNVLILPDRMVDETDMPCVLVMEGEDDIVKRGTRDYLGYPASRTFKVLIECWDFSDGDVKNIYNEVRKAVLKDKGVLLKGVIIREEKAVGHFNLGIPGILGMRIIFSFNYSDPGPFN